MFAAEQIDIIEMFEFISDDLFNADLLRLGSGHHSLNVNTERMMDLCRVNTM